MQTEFKLTKELLKKQVNIIRNFLKEGSNTNDISQSAAYSLLSKIYGFPNWDTMSAYLKSKELDND